MKIKSPKLLLSIAAVAAIFVPLSPATAQGRPQSVILNVPFVMQAPLGNWSDDRQQYGCEEASIVMAMSWARREINKPNDTIFKEEALRDIINMSEYERVIYGFYQDTSAQDTARVARDFYQYQDITVKENISVEDIRQELAQNRLVLIPLNTRLTGVPMYKNGPVRHMIIAVGYDDKNDEIIVHDPLLKNGAFLWLPASGLQAALWNYSSGVHLPLGARSTAFVSIGKSY